MIGFERLSLDTDDLENEEGFSEPSRLRRSACRGVEMSPPLPLPEVFGPALDPGRSRRTPDLMDRKTEFSRKLLGRRPARTPGQEEFVVFASGEGEGIGIQSETSGSGAESACPRNEVGVQARPATAAFEELRKVAHESIREIDTTAVPWRRQESAPRGDSRLWNEPDRSAVAFDPKPFESRTTERSSHADSIPRPHVAAEQGAAAGQRAKNGDGQGGFPGSADVAAHQGARPALGRAREPPDQGIQP